MTFICFFFSSRRYRLTSVDFDQNAVIAYKIKQKSKYEKQMKFLKILSKTIENDEPDLEDEMVNADINNDYNFLKNQQILRKK